MENITHTYKKRQILRSYTEFSTSGAFLASHIISGTALESTVKTIALKPRFSALRNMLIVMLRFSKMYNCIQKFPDCILTFSTTFSMLNEAKLLKIITAFSASAAEK